MCSSCGQKYRGLSQRRASDRLVRYRRLRGGRKEVVRPDPSIEVKKSETVETVSTTEKIGEIMTDPGDKKGFIDDTQPAGTIQPDTAEAVKGIESEYVNEGIDLVSGKPMEVLEKGSCSENDLGDTALTPIEVVDAPDDKNNVGA